MNKQAKQLCCGFHTKDWQPHATEYISAETARQRNLFATSWPDNIFATVWIPIREIASVFDAFPALSKLLHISNGPGYLRGVNCSHRSMPERWNYSS
jgi:hypothetical protein